MSLKVKHKKDGLMTQIKLTIPITDSQENHLDSAIRSIDIANENLNAAQSSIKDVDYASKASKFIPRPITH